MKFRRSEMLRGYSDEQLAKLQLQGKVILDEGVWYPAVSGMAPISRVTTQDATGSAAASTCSATYPATPTTGNLLIGVAQSLQSAAGGNVNIRTQTGAVPWTLHTRYQHPTQSIQMSIFYSYAVASQPTTIEVVNGASNTQLSIFEYQNTATSSPVGAAGSIETGNNAGPTAGGGLSTTRAASLIISALALGGTVTGQTVDSSFTILTANPSGGIRQLVADFISSAGSGTSYTPNFDWTTTRNWVHGTVEFLAPVSAQNVSISSVSSVNSAQTLHPEKHVFISVP